MVSFLVDVLPAPPPDPDRRRPRRPGVDPGGLVRPVRPRRRRRALRLAEDVRQRRLGHSHVLHRHRPGPLDRLPRPPVPGTPQGEELHHLLRCFLRLDVSYNFNNEQNRLTIRLSELFMQTKQIKHQQKFKQPQAQFLT